MTGTVIQINRSGGGLPKFPVEGALITSLGIEGDSHAHPAIHGGPLKAVLIVCAEVVEELVAKGYPLFYGALGENLTTRGLDRRNLRTGQRYRAGHAVIELTRLRQPCPELDIYGAGIKDEIYDEAARRGDPSSPHWAMSGFYAAVVVPGRITAGDAMASIDEAA